MFTRQLGRTDLAVSALCFGGNVFGWTLDEQDHVPYWMPTLRAEGIVSIRLMSTGKAHLKASWGVG